ncbi:glycoside hydrolase family 2 TIM barrel-domain containing protein [Diaminobutyricibacter tongyongensis]|uniref:glycoside hydrolase family 2 TIM barrel-domain containing protein n=1 Tax=Leifsonia tongyongensis TaxID=1268043 RepID=UPI00308442CE
MSVFSQLVPKGDQKNEVTLPHDAMITFARTESSGASNGYFPGGAVTYSKVFDVPEEWRRKRVAVEFEGVYRDAMVYVNGVFAGQHPNGYTGFRIALDDFLDYGKPNAIRVDARAHMDSRWYSGLGIYRDVYLTVTALTHITASGIRISTPDVDDERAVIAVATELVNEDISTQTTRLTTTIVDANGEDLARVSSPVTLRPGDSAVARHRLYLPNPKRWSVDTPNRYSVRSELGEGERLIETRDTAFGVRTLQIDPQNGLRINGESIKLRGACVHHDNGILGGAAFRRAEERKVELLKSAGFNAIRSSHNPMSPAMLDACDRLGMLVMDESFDMWTRGKNPFDYSLNFPEWWERDIEALVEKDFNRPSVIAYSIGNEILEAGNALSAKWGRAIAEKIRNLDGSRFITNSISGFVATISDILEDFQEQVGDLERGGVNDLMTAMGDLMNEISLSDQVTAMTEESHSVVDIVGHNYADARYLADQSAFPDRVVVGTETLSKRIDIIWDLVTRLPHVIGDFTWTGYDYLGEAGLGLTVYGPANEPSPDPTAYPGILAWCGDIDITGYRRPASFYREIVYGLRSQPFIAVGQPAPAGRRAAALDWAWSDTTDSWSWNLEEGAPLNVEVYSDAPEVELLVNGKSLGRAPAGHAARFRANFTVPYQPGELLAITRNGNSESGRSVLRTAAAPADLRLGVDRPVIPARDIAFVTIEVVDANGTLATNCDRTVSIDVDGPAELLALGSARPSTNEVYNSHSHTTFGGRALAVIRSTDVGEAIVTVRADGLAAATATINSA